MEQIWNSHANSFFLPNFLFFNFFLLVWNRMLKDCLLNVEKKKKRETFALMIEFDKKYLKCFIFKQRWSGLYKTVTTHRIDFFYSYIEA